MDMSALSWVGLAAAGAAVAAGWQTASGWLATMSFVPFHAIYLEEHTRAFFLVQQAQCSWSRWMYQPINPVVGGRRVIRTVRLPATDLALGFYKWRPYVMTERSLWFFRGTVTPDKIVSDLHAAEFEAERICGGVGKRFSIVSVSGVGSIHTRRAESSTQHLPSSMGDHAVVPMSAERSSARARHAASVPVECARADLVDKPASLSAGYVPCAAQAKVFRRISNWLTAGGWHAKYSLPWRLGVLLTGKPGTGKTTFALWVAEMLDLPVHVFDLASLSNNEFKAAWKEAGSHSPSIVLLEDIDAIFDGRTNLAGELGGGLTFDCLLNSLSGSSEVGGILVFVTTNFPEKLDEALRFRPGRIDVELEVGGLPRDGVIAMISRLVPDGHREGLIAAWADSCPTAAALKAVCVETALEYRASCIDKEGII